MIRQKKGAIATIVMYLRGKNKPSKELRSKGIQMAEKKTKEKEGKKEVSDKEYEELNTGPWAKY